MKIFNEKYYLWCKDFGMWCKDVPEIIGDLECDLDCKNCKSCEDRE